MNEEQTGEHRSWLERLGLFFTGEPEDREDLLELLRAAQKRNLIELEALSMIEGVMQVSELKVRDIMIPRAQMVVVSQDAELETIFPLVAESAHSRYPVIGEDRTEVVGILLVKDLLIHSLKDKTKRVKEIMRPAQFVPESKRLNVLLKEFRTTRSHMAIVVDEYGAAAGLVTIEDVLEQIVGEIEDEHDFGEEEYIFRKNDREYTLKALTPIDEFNDYFYVDFNDDEFDTIGGLIVHQLGHVPKRGEKVEIDRFRFIVLRADSRRVHLLKLILLPQPESQSETSARVD
ncbi:MULTISPECIES: HlyC/CorC family transporter [Methylocaldum]|jgi:magnesium and cobalt transporter|uniref:HlyC/CorC family transporter n=1 Tax=unclassified Methylocaldum TaxID=2622260 RepID=UPI00098B6859|nr:MULTISPECIES: transporter associated domain-containing protein [unclassified Methylocaldum]MBP1150068.1 magnesium and cobalt transporter [Methylocaldum sp. RMAD-M]MVF23199.1 CBS domain-containing protein [Methylocaldum sp. BRCS4]